MKTILQLLLAAGLLLLSACSSSRKNDPEPAETFTPIPGLGKSKERPVGTPFTWPAGIKLLGKPNADKGCSEEARKNKRLYGAGGMVQVCLTLQNTNPGGSTPLVVRFPHGLVWFAETEVYQNGIVITPISIEVPPEGIMHVSLAMYCANAGRDVPIPGDSFEEQPMQIEHPALEELYQIVANKKLNLEEYGGQPDRETQQQLAFVQIALWEITETGKIKPETLRMLESLPDK